MQARWIGFGEIEVEGERYDHDIVIDEEPSKSYRDRFGHTPLSAKETIPWSGKRLIIGTGADGQLPIMPAVWAEAERHGTEIVALPTEEALRLLCESEARDVHAVLHVTC